MAGEYGEIDSRNDFFRVLGECQKICGDILRVQPKNQIIEVIDTELDAMWRWTQNDREPTEDERKSIDIGLIAVRELENSGDPTIDALADKLGALNNYFEDWPTDDEAANATDDDFFDREEDDDD
jgi:hypothetical protein